MSDGARDAYELHKPIRNRIRQYERDAALRVAMAQLLANEEDITNNDGYHPWLCMLLIRWILQYGSPGYHLKKPTIDTINGLLNEIGGLYDKVLTLKISTPYDLNKFMRRMAFWQFSYQMPIRAMGWNIGRQIILFDKMGRKHCICDRFSASTGLSIREFLKITFSIFSLLHSKDHNVVNVGMFNKSFSEESLKKYFDLVAVTPADAKKFLEDNSNKKSNRFFVQLYEMSPLVRKPFLKIGDEYIIFSKRLFRQFSSNFIYDYLYESDKFIEFGEIFEKYVGERINNLGIDVIRDRQWKKKLSRNISEGIFPSVRCLCIWWWVL